ncbi:VpsF family polysaccharide biosynthesis protein [Lichenihabitans sp. Uapishka_5]|uniref:VpsF family polysaccharide biosynthesis protein n=1 Tax=Lichenihabitans sp. Uapishka_5 TaxID=3037302 RepID=UPI0029E7EB45|nr:VpsF family polysaccharide biosynthesis protein [Lichenihabitans sp. Uapishka_5]MDX7953979.1 VpsF family polysaccharide biosynthesis protein [Lichenihabitans sp. Uapishka_5]
MSDRSFGQAPIDGWPAAAITAGIMAALLVPASLLTLIGLNYDTANGGAWEKVHPGSDLILLGLAAAALRSGAPGPWLVAQGRRYPGAAAFVATTLFLLIYQMVVLHAPFTPLIDTFLIPVAALVGLQDLHPAWKHRLEAALHLFIAANALLGIAEFVSGWRLIPAELDGVVQTAEVEARAFGFLGHPLSSAAMAGLYATVLMLGGGRGLPAGLRAPALGLQALALGAFGGRTALVLAALAAVAIAGVALVRVLAGRPVDLRLVGLGLLLAPLGLGMVAAIASSGFFDVVLNRFIEDNGSAKSRGIILTVFGYLSWPDLLFGPDPDALASVLHLVGIEVGVESTWLGFILNDGLLPSLVFFTGFGLFIAEVMRRCAPAAWGVMLFFFGIISTSIGLSAKTTMLVEVVALLLILLPPGAPHRRARFLPTPAFP